MSLNLIAYEGSTLMSNEKYIGLDIHQARLTWFFLGRLGNPLFFGQNKAPQIRSEALPNSPPPSNCSATRL